MGVTDLGEGGEGQNLKDEPPLFISVFLIAGNWLTSLHAQRVSFVHILMNMLCR